VLGGLLVNVAALVAVLGFVLQSRAQARSAVVVTTQNMARLLDEVLTAAFDRIDLALLAVQDEVAGEEVTDPDSASLNALLAKQKSRTPDLLALRLLDREGVVRHSAPSTVDPVSLADRDYFLQLREGVDSIVSRPISGRVTKTPIMVFARRLVDGRGSFAGVVIGVVDLRHIAEMVSDPDMGPHGAIALRADDLSLVARSGPGGAAAALSQTAVSDQMKALRGRSAATFDALSPADGVQRTYSFRRLPRHPFYIVVGLAPVDYLAAWHRQTVLAALLLAGFVALTSLGTWLARLAWQQQQRAEEELARFQRVESLAVLAGGIAHDFNNLLTAIAGNISLAREEAAPGSPAGDALADAEAASMRARGLTHQLLTFSRGGAPVKKRVDLSPLVVEAARFAAHGAGTALRFETAPGLEIEADTGQVAQVVQNLVLNGIQAMGSKGTLVVQTERVTLPLGDPRGWRPGPYALVSVVDAGPGIPPEVLPHIFDPFFTTKATGKGLGLAICHSIVVKHEGHLEVSLPRSGGATFQVWLPAIDSHATPAPSDPPVRASLPAAGQRILIMDDELTVRRLVVRLLHPLGYDVVESGDGEQTVACYREALAAGRPFAAVIIDLTIPGGMGGLETLGRLRQLDPGVVAIVSSGYSNDPILANWAEHGFQAVLAKPYVATELRDTLRRLL
jgi:signal transduction histidine kinase/ActR/RegA family two-component response regulator